MTHHHRLIQPIAIVITILIIDSMTIKTTLADEDKAIKQGKYVLQAAGGCSCHTALETPNEKMSGGRALKTPFGVIYSSNITPDKKTGIGSWTDDEFINAMTKGKRPDGSHLFPVFPYTTFTQIAQTDLLNLKRYLETLTPVEKKNKPNEMMPPFGWRFGLFFWKWLHFTPGTYQPNPQQSTQWNRGAYLVNSLAHCGECHTPRGLSGAIKRSMRFAGSSDGPEGELAPNITPDKETGIGSWTIDDMTWFLQTGLKPNGDATEGLMNEVIVEGYQYLTPEDLTAIATYIVTLPPISNQIE